MKNKYLLICIVICQVFIACKNEYGTAHLPTIELNPDYNNNSFKFDEIFKSVKIIPLETDSNYVVGGVSKLVESSQSLFIMDDRNNKIFRFNIQGKFLNKIGQAGNGPGEYLKVKDFAIDETSKQVAIYDVRGRKIIIYNFDGTFIREFNVNFFLHSIVVDENGSYYGFTGSISNRSYAKNSVLKKLKFIKFDKNGNVTKNITGHNNSQIWLDMYEHISFQSDGTISFAEPLQNTLYRLKNDIIEPYYSIDFKNYFVPDNVKEQLDFDDVFESQEKRDYFIEANKKYILGLLKFHENDNWIVMQYMINYKYQFAFFDKQSKRLFESSRLPISLEKKSTFFTPKYINNNFIYSSQSAFFLHEKFNNEKNDKMISDSRIKDWEIFIDKIDINDNPVIFRYELRNNRIDE
jgi:hypothetical protein